jgi:transcription elongation factor GreB
MSMSKAFTKESDSEEPSLLPEMPIGVRNYITPAGLLSLQNALHALTEQSGALSHDGQSNEAGDETTSLSGEQNARDVDQRIQYLRTRIESAEVVDPGVHVGNDQIFFGATVRYRDASKQEHTVSIVGLDELDPANGKVSWLSPVAQALLNAYEGDTVELDGPGGLEKLCILAVHYPNSSD